MCGTTPGAVSYVALAYTKDKPITVIKVNGVAPSPATITTGKYPIWSYEHIFTKGKAKPEVEQFFAMQRPRRPVGTSLIFTRDSVWCHPAFASCSRRD